MREIIQISWRTSPISETHLLDTKFQNVDPFQLSRPRVEEM
jgi:peptide methionine sulfoxide reductase MsrA